MRDAQTLAVRRNHQGVDVEHVLAALLAQTDGVAPVLLERAGVAGRRTFESVSSASSHGFRRSPDRGRAATPYLTQRLAKLMAQAETEASDV